MYYETAELESITDSQLIVSRIRLMRRPMPPLLELWREQHLEGQEQAVLSFENTCPAAVLVSLFASADTLV